VIDHIDKVDLLELAADLGCISAEEQSFTFKPDDSAGRGANSQSRKSGDRSDHKQHSNGLTFSDAELEINSNFEGNIVCEKPAKLKMVNRLEDGCSGSYH